MNIDVLTADWFRNVFPSASSMAIVGNGPVDVSDTKIIDGSDVVVRFNDFDRRPGLCQEHRTPRCDLLVTHFDCIPSPAQLPKGILHAIPPPFQLERNRKICASRYPHQRHAMVNPFEQQRLCRELGLDSDGYKHPLPTVGFTWLWHFHQLSIPMSIFLCGFTWHYDAASFTYDKFKALADKLPPRLNHYYLKEAVWVQRNWLGGSNISFSSAAYDALSPLSKFIHFPWEGPGGLIQVSIIKGRRTAIQIPPGYRITP